jgi:hypothetical protein
MLRDIRRLVSLSAFCCAAAATQGAETPADSAQNKPEEIIVTGQRSTMQLRIQLLEAEQIAYEIFNQFNDDTRFDISCSDHAQTGSRFKRQVCQPEFEIQAMRGHAQDYYNSMPGPGRPPDGSVTQQFLPLEVELQRHKKAYREKLREVAEKHPEFRDAIARYAALQQEYKTQTEVSQ